MNELNFINKSQNRIDLAIKTTYPHLSRTFISDLIKQQCVLVNQQFINKPSLQVKPHDNIIIHIPVPQPSNIVPYDQPLNIVYEDNDLLVINKPPFLPIHPSYGHQNDTLVNILIYHFPSFKDFSAINGIFRPGIIHRLDMNTSGLLVVAKNQPSMNILQNDIQNRKWTKKYYALVLNNNNRSRGLINTNIVRCTSDRKKYCPTHLNQGKSAITNYATIQNYQYQSNQISLTDIQIETGRTHQIRVHLLSEDMPILGDPLYHNKESQKLSKMLHIKRQLLHAYHLEIFHPITQEKLIFNLPLPDDFQQIISIMQ